jgi:hypothetical protein
LKGFINFHKKQPNGFLSGQNTPASLASIGEAKKLKKLSKFLQYKQIPAFDSMEPSSFRTRKFIEKSCLKQNI